MAVAGGVLFSCTGGKVIPRVSPAATGIDTRWPIKRVLYVMMENRSFDNLFGTVPRRERHHGGREVGGGDTAHPMPRLAARRPPPRPSGGAQLPERGQAGRVRRRCVRRPVVLLAVPGRPAPQLLVLGQGVRALRQLLRLRPGAVLPEPLLLHRRTVGRHDRQPREHRGRAGTRTTTSSRAGDATRSATTCSSWSRTTRGTSRSTTRASGSRRSANSSRRSAWTGGTTRRSPDRWGTSGTPTTGSTASSTPTCGTSTPRTRWTGWCTTSRRTSCRPSHG